MCSDQGEKTTCALVCVFNEVPKDRANCALVCAFDEVPNSGLNSSNRENKRRSGGPPLPTSTLAPTAIKCFGRKPKSRTLQAPAPPPIECPIKTSTPPSARSSSGNLVPRLVIEKG